MNTKFLEKITDIDFLSRLVLYLSIIGIFSAVVSFVFLEQIVRSLIQEALLIVLGVLGIGYFLRCRKLKKDYLKSKVAMAKENIKLYTDLKNILLQIPEHLPQSLKQSDSWIAKQIENCQQNISQAKKELKDLEGEWSFCISSSSLLSGYFLALYVRSIQIFYEVNNAKRYFSYKIVQQSSFSFQRVQLLVYFLHISNAKVQFFCHRWFLPFDRFDEILVCVHFPWAKLDFFGLAFFSLLPDLEQVLLDVHSSQLLHSGWLSSLFLESLGRRNFYMHYWCSAFSLCFRSKSAKPCLQIVR